MTNEQKAEKIAALLEEKRGYETRGLTDRAKAVDAQLKALGQAGQAPAKRSAKRKGD